MDRPPFLRFGVLHGAQVPQDGILGLVLLNDVVLGVSARDVLEPTDSHGESSGHGFGGDDAVHAILYVLCVLLWGQADMKRKIVYPRRSVTAKIGLYVESDLSMYFQEIL